MTFFEEFFSNHIFLTAACGWFVAQILKTLIHLIISKKSWRSVWWAAVECPVRIPLPYVHWSLRHATNTAPAVSSSPSL